MDKFEGGDKVQGADALQAIEERLAHFQRAVDDLSDVVARQDAEIRRMARHVGLLMERAAEQEAEEGSIALADQRPPHW